MRVTLMVLALGALLAAPAAAQGPPVAPLGIEPADGTTVVRAAPVTFRVTADPSASSVAVLLAHGDSLGAIERTEARLEGDVWVATLPADALVPQRPGSYRWRAIAEVTREDGTPWTMYGPERRLDVVAPPDALDRGPIPARFGRRRGGRLLISSRNLPEGITRARFRSLARVTARRWGIRVGAWTTRDAGVTDGSFVVGFTRHMPRARAVGMVRPRFRRRTLVTRRCLGDVCRVVSRTPLPPRLVDKDVLLHAGVPWWPGPGYPVFDSYDLETVLLHEFGHFAGNLRHAAPCSGSPLVPSLTYGDWWRGPRDWFKMQCVGL